MSVLLDEANIWKIIHREITTERREQNGAQNGRNVDKN